MHGIRLFFSAGVIAMPIPASPFEPLAKHTFGYVEILSIPTKPSQPPRGFSWACKRNVPCLPGGAPS